MQVPTFRSLCESRRSCAAHKNAVPSDASLIYYIRLNVFVFIPSQSIFIYRLRGRKRKPFYTFYFPF